MNAKPSNFNDSQLRAIKRLIDSHLYKATQRVLENAFDRRQPRFIQVGGWMCAADQIKHLSLQDTSKPDGMWRLEFLDGHAWIIPASDANSVRRQLERSRL